MPEAVWFELRRHGEVVQHGVVALLGFGRGNVADGFEQAPVIEPVHPFESGVLDGLEGAPRPAPMDHLGLVEAVDCLGEGVVVGVADAADGRLDPGLGKPLGVFDRQILAAAVAVMDEAALMSRPAVMNGLFEGIEDEAGMGRPADPPADDPAREGVDHEGHIDEARPGRDIGEVGDPEPVRRRRVELPVHLVERARRRLVADRRLHRLAPDDALEAHLPHQPLHRATGDIEPFALHLAPDLPHAIDLEVLGEYPRDIGLQLQIPAGPGGQPRGVVPLANMLVVAGRGDRQNPADRLDPVSLPMLVDERDHLLNGRSSSAWAK